MRSYEIIRELSYDSFIETYGRVPAQTRAQTATDKTTSVSKRHSMFVRTRDVIGVKTNGCLTAAKDNDEHFLSDNADSNNNAIGQEPASDTFSPSASSSTAESKAAKIVSPVYRRLRKISLRKKDSIFVGEKKKTSAIQRSQSISCVNATSTKSSFRKSNWLSSPNFYRKSSKEALDAECVQVPLSKMNFAAYRGFLSKRNEKKQEWERFWCVLQDTCLYCYSSPKSEFAEDVIALCGANVKVGQSASASSTTIILQKSKTECYKFKADSQNQLNAWLGVLNAHASGKVCKKQQKPIKKITRSASAVNSYSCTSKNSSKTIQRSSSDQQVNVTNAKANLLRELLAQREQILREQKILERITATKQRSVSCSPAVIHKRGKTSSVSSLTQSEDVGYCSSLDGSMHDALSEYEESRSEPPLARQNRTLSAVSAASTSSLRSIAEEKLKSKDVCPRILAEIEEFRAFSKRTLLERANSN